MKTFEKLYSEYFGEPIENERQITKANFTGEELKHFVNYCYENGFSDGFSFANKQASDEISKNYKPNKL